MHVSSLSNMRAFADEYLSKDIHYRILDLGSQEVDGDGNGSYRKIFQGKNWTYEGADLVPGNNVDIVLEKPYKWKNIKSKTYDCVVCGQMLEHDEYFWITMLEIRRILKPNGLCCMIAPSGGAEHRYPVDCYRFYPDGLKAVANYASLEVLEVYAQWNEELYPEMDSEWRDCVMICRRNPLGIKKEVGAFWRYFLIQRASKEFNNISYGDTYSWETTWKTPSPNMFSSLYYDTGRGYNQDEVEFCKVPVHQEFVHKYSLPNGCRSVRFDPVEGYHCLMANFKVVTEKGEVSKEHWDCNGEQIDSHRFLFLETTDPQISISDTKVEESAWVEVSADIYYLG